MERDDAQSELLRRYFTHFGPATVRDAAYFFGWTQRTIRERLKHLPVMSFPLDGRIYYHTDVPEGAMNDSMRQVVRDLGYTSVLWTLDTRDWAHTPPDKISDYIIQNAKNGDIILMHDYIGANSPTVQALETFIPILLDRGFTFVTAGELLQNKV